MNVYVNVLLCIFIHECICVAYCCILYSAQAALAEIARVLRPGGVFVASTFMTASAPLGALIGDDDLVRPLNQVSTVEYGCNTQTQAVWGRLVSGL